MTEAVRDGFITDPSELQYIWDVVNQVLDKKHFLGSLQDFQSSLKETSLSRGREVQMNLVSDSNQWVGFNFSFKTEPNRTTSTIPFKQQQLELEQRESNNLARQPQTFAIDVAAAPINGNLSPLTSQGKLAATPSLQAEAMRVLPEEERERIKSPAPDLKMNPSLARIAAHLASRHELDGLWLTGTALKTGTTLAKSLETEPQPDIQSAGNAVIKRFERVLPQQFSDLKNGISPQPFNWKDPNSGKQYRFEFEAATSSETGQPLSPATLKGFEQSDRKSIFSAQLLDAKRHYWFIEQCEFSPVQLRSLAACDKPIHRLGTPERSANIVENER